MKTLFLMAIAVILAVIAVKEPDQTAQEAILELYGKMKTVVQETTDPLPDQELAEGATKQPAPTRTEPSYTGESFIDTLVPEPNQSIPVESIQEQEPVPEPNQSISVESAQEPESVIDPTIDEPSEGEHWPPIPSTPSKRVDIPGIEPPTPANPELDHKSAEAPPVVEWKDVSEIYDNAKQVLEEIQ